MINDNDIQALRDARAYLRWLQRSGFEVFRSELQARVDSGDKAGQPGASEPATVAERPDRQKDAGIAEPGGEKRSRFSQLS